VNNSISGRELYILADKKYYMLLMFGLYLKFFFLNLDLIQLKKNTVFILLQHLSRARRYFSQNVRPLIKVSRVWLLQYFHFVILFFYIELILSLFFKKNADPSKLRVLHYLCFFS
jgi:hypothetical protein